MNLSLRIFVNPGSGLRKNENVKNLQFIFTH